VLDCPSATEWSSKILEPCHTALCRRIGPDVPWTDRQWSSVGPVPSASDGCSVAGRYRWMRCTGLVLAVEPDHYIAGSDTSLGKSSWVMWTDKRIVIQTAGALKVHMSAVATDGRHARRRVR
jgi:hypothetical protein